MLHPLFRLIFLLSFVAGTFSLFAAEKEPEPHPLRGVYGIWASNLIEATKLPYVKGGQIITQWKDVNPAPGKFDFSYIEKELKKHSAAKNPVTIQINGIKPEWLFDRVPYVPKAIIPQVQDSRGTLMFWHPAFLEAHREMLAAFGKFLEHAPGKEFILGVRQNFNAIGTEHLHVGKDYEDLSKWIVPRGVAPGERLNRKLRLQYQEQVLGWYIKYVAPHTRVFVRNNILAELLQRYEPQFKDGTLSWFHTSSEIEPRSKKISEQYETFLKYCKTGQTLAYAEPWASAWGHHGTQTDERWCSPPQWNYWRLLSDLHCGVSFIAVYRNDLQVASQGIYKNKPFPQYQAEFDQAYRFAAKYAGYHASPSRSPGAWIAFREGNVLPRDYTFLMSREPDKSRGIQTAGPEEQRFGAWARVLPKGETMRLKVDERFLRSLGKATIAITYLDQGNGKLACKAGEQTFSHNLTGTGRWKTFTANWEKPSRPEIEISSGNDDLTLHMVEIRRGSE